MSTSAKLPGYAETLLAYHRAFAPELSQLIAKLPLAPGDRVLDLASGDGVYTGWLTERGAQVIAVDFSRAFLDLAKSQVEQEVSDGQAGLVMADVKTLPFPENAFDLVWCAQSLYSLPDPVEAISAMHRLVKPGGRVVVLENDEFHHVLLPWPVEVELALRHAELLVFLETSEKPGKFYIGRHLRKVFRAAGFHQFERVCHPFDRQAPLGEAERDYFAGTIEDLRTKAKSRLNGEVLRKFEALVDPDSPGYMLDDPDFTVTCVNHLALGVKEDTH